AEQRTAVEAQPVEMRQAERPAVAQLPAATRQAGAPIQRAVVLLRVATAMGVKAPVETGVEVATASHWSNRSSAMAPTFLSLEAFSSRSHPKMAPASQSFPMLVKMFFPAWMP